MPVLGYPGLARKDQAAATPAPVPSGAGTIVLALAGVPRVSSSALALMRAGFESRTGIRWDFGFSSATFFDGDPVQTLNIGGSSDGTASGTTVHSSVTTQIQGSPQTVTSISSNPPTTSLITTANNGLTSVQTIIGSAGLSTIIKNQADNQLIQHFQTITLTISGLNAMVSQQVTQSILSRALDAGHMFQGR